MIGQAQLRQVKKCCRPIPIPLTTKIQKTCKDFQKILEIKTRSAAAAAAAAAAKPEVKTFTKKKRQKYQ